MADDNKVKKGKKFEINSNMFRIGGVILCVVIIILIVVFTARSSSKQRQAASMVVYSEAPQTQLFPSTLTGITGTMDGYAKLDDGTLIVEIDGKKYLVTPNGEVFLINEDGTLGARVTDAEIVAQACARAAVATKGDSSYEGIANNLRLDNLSEAEREKLAKGLDLNVNAVNDFANSKGNTLSDWMREHGDRDLSHLSDDEISELARILGVNAEDLKALINRGMSLLEILEQFGKDVNLGELSNSDLAWLADLLDYDFDELLAKAMAKSLGQFFNGGARTRQEALKNTDKEILDAIRTALEMANLSNIYTPEEVKKILEQGNITLDDFIRDALANGIRNAVSGNAAPMADFPNDDDLFSKNPTKPTTPLDSTDITTTPYPVVTQTSSSDLDSMLSNLDAAVRDIYSGGNTVAAQDDGGYIVQNAQKQKKEFLEENQTGTEIIGIEKKDNMLLAGTAINIKLITGINSDLPGQITAIVERNVYDSFYLKNILIPKGSRMVGKYDSNVTWGQKRILVTWNQISRPDGVIIKINGYQGVDNMGYAGYSGKVNNHIGAIIGATALQTALDVGTLAVIDKMGSNSSGGTLARGVLSGVTNLSSKILDKTTNRQPTITIPAGTSLIVLTNDNVEVPIYR